MLAAFLTWMYPAPDEGEKDPANEVQVNFEHGQWWVTVKPTGAQWSVHDAEGHGSVDGFGFEQVTEGDDA